MRVRRKKMIAAVSTTAMVSTMLVLGASVGAHAQQTPGDAPFINSWLVSGPFDTAVADETYDCDSAEAVNLALTSKATASSELDANPATQVNDGDLRKQWVAESDEAPTITLTWDSSISLNEVSLAQWGDSRHVNGSYQLTFTLADGSTVEAPVVESTSASPSSPTVYTADETLQDVVSMTVAIDPGLSPYPSITGLSEIEVYERTTPADNEEQITPVLGESFSDDAKSGEWEYFDDRLYNRNYDDYQDLYGYYSVKKGEDTTEKFVYAHTYVYSAEEQTGFVNVGASGSYKLFVNDTCVTDASSPVEVQKDLTRQEVPLKQGWNKVLLQIEHTFTEDVNENGVPIAKDQDVAYLGFYGRISDKDGNRLDGVTSSVTGPSKELKIDTQTLTGATKDGKDLTSAELPTGYLEWPYVWNKSVADSNHGVSASPFQFLASGGEPGYTWKLVKGVLPLGLELNADGTIADGLVDGEADLSSQKGIISPKAKIGDYKFTLEVTDAAGNSVKKKFTLEVKDRPNREFEEGRVSALTHAAPMYNYFVDPNYSVDQWAARAKAQGHAMVSVEALQQNYHWPSKFSDPAGERQKYLPKGADGNVVDGLAPMVGAIRRYGMDVGIYYATEGGGLAHFSTDVFVQNIEDLLDRYDPSYLYFDGPQAMPNANYDVMYSSIRNHSENIVIDSNAWGEEYGDPDIRTAEASHIYANAGADHLVKQTPMEPWKIVGTKNQDSPYYDQRDDFRLVAQETIMNAGRGYVDNNDQTVVDGRGPNWHTPSEIVTRYPKGAQEFIDIREDVADWFAPAPGINLLESISGTTPFYLPGYGYEDDGLGNYENFGHPDEDTGPQWGYATARDNNIYLHIVKGPDGKKGFEAINDHQLEIGGVTDKVTAVSLLNTDKKIKSFTQKDETLSLDLSKVDADPVDTIIKIETKNSERKYALTDVTVDATALSKGRLQLDVGGYMTYPALSTDVDSVKYSVPNSGVVKISKDGVVVPHSNGSAEVTVTAKLGKVTKTTKVTINVRGKIAYIGEELSSAVLEIGGKETYGTFSINAQPEYSLEGRSDKGQSVRLGAADVVWHAGIVDLAGGTKTEPVAVTEVDTFSFADGKVTTPEVSKATRGVAWAEVTLDGKKVTTNRVFLDLLPTRDVAGSAKIKSSDRSASTKQLTDGITIDADHLAGSGWSTDGEGSSWVQFDLDAPTDLSSVDLTFNGQSQKYFNTPKEILIQTSTDGKTWEDAKSAAGPTGAQFWRAIDSYPVTGVAEHVRVSFPAGSNGASLDVLEVQIQAKHEMTALASIDVTPKVSKGDRKVTVDVKGRSFQEKSVKLRDDAISLTSDNPDVASVDSRGAIKAGDVGKAKITVTATRKGYSATDYFYVAVGKDGRISLPSFLKDVKLTLSEPNIQVGQPVVANVEATLNTGAVVNPTEIDTAFTFSDSRLEQVPNSNTIVLTEPVTGTVKVDVRATVTSNGESVTSNAAQLSATGANIAGAATATVSSVRDRNGVPDGNDQDPRYVGSKATDSDLASSWASKQTDVSPSINLKFPAPVQIDRINLVDRGHEVNQISEGLLEWEGGSKVITGIKWDGQPDNMITLDEPINTSWVKFTIDPDNVFDNQARGGEVGLAEFAVFAPDAEQRIVDVIAVEVDTTVGKKPTLPAEADAVYSDGTTASVSIDWDDIPAAAVAKAGWFTVEGTITGTEVKATAVVTVK